MLGSNPGALTYSTSALPLSDIPSFLIFFKRVCVCMCAHVHTRTLVKTAWFGFWELNYSPMEEYWVLLATELSPEP